MVAATSVKFLLWAAAATGVAKASPLGPWQRDTFCYPSAPLDAVFLIDDALASDGSLKDFFIPSDISVDPKYALARFNKPVGECGLTGLLENEVEVCVGIPSLVDEAAFEEALSKELAGTAAADVDETTRRARDTSFAGMAGGSVVFREGSLRIVTMFAQETPRFNRGFNENPDLPCPFHYEKETWSYYSPYCSSSAYPKLAIVSNLYLVNHVYALVLVADGGDQDAWKDYVSGLGAGWGLPVTYRFGVTQEDFVKTVMGEIYSIEATARCLGDLRPDDLIPWNVFSSGSIARGGEGATTMDPNIFMLFDDALTEDMDVYDIPDPLKAQFQGFRFNKYLGGCLPAPTPHGFYDRLDRDGCGFPEGFPGAPGYNPGVIIYSPLNFLKTAILAGDEEGLVMGGARAMDLANAVYAATLGALTLESPPVYRSRILVIHTALSPHATRTPCPFELEDSFVPTAGIAGFNILCTAQTAPDLAAALREAVLKGTQLLVVVPEEAVDTGLLTEWQDFLKDEVNTFPEDTVPPAQNVFAGKLTDGMQDFLVDYLNGSYYQ